MTPLKENSIASDIEEETPIHDAGGHGHTEIRKNFVPGKQSIKNFSLIRNQYSLYRNETTTKECRTEAASYVTPENEMS